MNRIQWAAAWFILSALLGIIGSFVATGALAGFGATVPNVLELPVFVFLSLVALLNAVIGILLWLQKKAGVWLGLIWTLINVILALVALNVVSVIIGLLILWELNSLRKILDSGQPVPSGGWHIFKILFLLLILAIVALFALGFLLSGLGSIGLADLVSKDLQITARDELREAFISSSTPARSRNLELTPFELSTNLLYSAELGLNQENICLSAGDFSNNPQFVQTGGNYLKYSGTSMNARVFALCSYASDLKNFLQTAGKDPNWANSCDLSQPTSTVCLLALVEPS